MRDVLVCVAIVGACVVASAQTLVTLRIEVALPGVAQSETPVPQHALLISDNPSTITPRRVVTRADGSTDVRLRPGSYTIESDQPVVIAGRAYQWTEIIDLRADTTLRLTVANAEATLLENSASRLPSPGLPSGNAASLLTQWQQGIAAVWTPASRASAFLVDAQGLMVTSRAALGTATDVELQIDNAFTVPARVVFTSPSNAAAVLWVNPQAVTARPVLPLRCPVPAASALDDGQEVATLGWALRRGTDVTWGEVTGLSPRAIEADLRVPFGFAGGPVFDSAGIVVGATTLSPDADPRRPRDADIVRAGVMCEAIAAARTAVAGASPPAPTPRTLTPVVDFPVDALAKVAETGAPILTPPALTSPDFEIAFLTPPVIHQAQQRAGRTGGPRTRDPEAEMRLGRITDFGAWSDYFADLPAVLAIRVTPKLVEGFWQRLGRGAAMTQGAILPAFKDFKTDFGRMQVSCDGVEVTPIHPLVIEHRLSDSDTVREGLYVFAPDAVGARCQRATLTLYAHRSTRGLIVTVPPEVLQRISQDFAPLRVPRP
ncbi:MAG: trypsin-like peptidase domain-containing protein [Acidobacteria bacterium]|nr:trypsin-like peptidase domain-containing protein [Acidobacteriota bacterium]